MTEVTIRLGKQCDEKAVDRSMIVEGRKPTVGDVEGQSPVPLSIVCWNCWAVNQITFDSHIYADYYFSCWNCGTVNNTV